MSGRKEKEKRHHFKKLAREHSDAVDVIIQEQLNNLVPLSALTLATRDGRTEIKRLGMLIAAVETYNDGTTKTFRQGDKP